ncbi:hypothetical protein [Aurantiacibacter odishensis]|uniref:hypothetical protein n=1 Tax=Aurantiacibacter odishensis TaxID=1155476 RepID=UPI000E74C1E3|nr:hypothetical protein [Aurantiacibacter odishensis]
MLTGLWPSPSGNDEYVLGFDADRARRVLLLRGLFDEGNKLRHFTVELMRRLDVAGIDSFLPDLPGTNESLAPLERQTLAGWREAMRHAANHFRATHVLAIRGGALVAPATLPNVHYAPASGPSLLRAMLRAQVMVAREAGRADTREELLRRGRTEGLQLAGYRIGPEMIAELEQAQPEDTVAVEIAQGDVGGGGLWLRVEPGHDPAQADRLAALVAERLP